VNAIRSAAASRIKPPVTMPVTAWAFGLIPSTSTPISDQNSSVSPLFRTRRPCRCPGSFPGLGSIGIRLTINISGSTRSYYTERPPIPLKVLTSQRARRRRSK
jgi:hypothetical protein